MKSNIIECRGAVVRPARSGDEAILRVDDFRVSVGEQVAVMGPSGSGKSTLLNVVAGMTRPAEGQVNVLGVDLYALPESSRDRFRGERIGYVFQSFHLFPYMSALDNVLVQHAVHPRWSASEARARASELLRRVGLGHRTAHKSSLLSRGEQQRVAIARALLHEPSLVLADEPTGNLDVATAGAVMDMLCGLCRERGAALVAVTHDELVAARFERIERMSELNRTYKEALSKKEASA